MSTKMAAKYELYNITYGNIVFPSSWNEGLQCPTKSDILAYNGYKDSSYEYTINISGNYSSNQLVPLANISISATALQPVTKQCQFYNYSNQNLIILVFSNGEQIGSVNLSAYSPNGSSHFADVDISSDITLKFYQYSYKNGTITASWYGSSQTVNIASSYPTVMDISFGSNYSYVSQITFEAEENKTEKTGILLLQITQSANQTPPSTGVTFNKCIIYNSEGTKLKEFDINLTLTSRGQKVGTSLDTNFTTTEKTLTCEVYATYKDTIAVGATSTYNDSLSPKPGWLFECTHSLG